MYHIEEPSTTAAVAQRFIKNRPKECQTSVVTILRSKECYKDKYVTKINMPQSLECQTNAATILYSKGD